MKDNPYGFVNEFGGFVDWSGLAGEVCRAASGHDQPISKEELAVLCAAKQREINLVRSLKSMKFSGETLKAQQLVKQVLG